MSKTKDTAGYVVGIGLVIIVSVVLAYFMGKGVVWFFKGLDDKLDPKGMTNEQIIKEVQKCKDAGLKHYAVYNTANSATTKIFCDGDSGK